MLKNRLSNNKGFTLLELVVVIAVVAILAVAVAPNFMGQIENSRVSKAIADFNTIRSASYMHYADTAHWPTTTGAAITLLTEDGFDGDVPAGWSGPYVDRIPTNHPWGFAYSYVTEDENIYVELEDVPLASALSLVYALEGVDAAAEYADDGEGTEESLYEGQLVHVDGTTDGTAGDNGSGDSTTPNVRILINGALPANE